jgi:hypothetical protein
LISLSGCASHKVVHQPSLLYDLNAQENKIENEGVICMVKPIHLKSELESYFDDDLLKHGVLPVQISLCNKSYGGSLSFSVDSINLVDPSNARSPLLSCDQVLDKIKKSYWRTAGWTVAFGVFGLVPSAINVSNTNRKIQADYESRLIKGGNLIEGGITEGLAYFSVPEDLSNLSGWTVSVILKDNKRERNVVLDHCLSGTVVSPKERKPKKEEQ